MTDPSQLKLILEGALLATGRPLTIDDLLGLFDEDERPERDAVRSALDALQEDYAERSFTLKEVASGYRLQVKRELSPWISRLWMERPSRYSRALLETLALVAYRQPITRGEIEDIRGVSVSSSIMKTLQEREWIRVVGHRDVPGKPAMYATTKQFLDYFDLKSLDELPTLAELRDIDSINAELDLREPGAETSDEAVASAELEDDGSEERSAVVETSDEGYQPDREDAEAAESGAEVSSDEALEVEEPAIEAEEELGAAYGEVESFDANEEDDEDADESTPRQWRENG